MEPDHDVVIGGAGSVGSAGSVLAARLAERPGPVASAGARWSALERALRVATARAQLPTLPRPARPGGHRLRPGGADRARRPPGVTNDAYLEPARARPNLTILGDTQVERVLLDGRARVGVRWAWTAG